MNLRTAASFAPLACALALAACQRTPSEPASHPGAGSSAEPSTATPPPSNATPQPFRPFGDLHAGAPGSGGMVQGPPPPSGTAGATIAWDDPPGWVHETPSSSMRRAQYRIPRAPGDTADAELVVFYFGPGQGGDIESNLTRWFGQVQQPDGRNTADVATRRTMMVGPFNVTIAEAAGRLGGGMGMPGMPAATSIEHGRLLGAIVQTPDGPWFFKMTGPDATVAAARPAFEQMLRSMHAGGP